MAKNFRDALQCAQTDAQSSDPHRRVLERVGLQRLEARVVHKAREVGVTQEGGLHFAASDRKLPAALVDAEPRKDGVDDERLARVDRRRRHRCKTDLNSSSGLVSAPAFFLQGEGVPADGAIGTRDEFHHHESVNVHDTGRRSGGHCRGSDHVHKPRHCDCIRTSDPKSRHIPLK